MGKRSNRVLPLCAITVAMALILVAALTGCGGSDSTAASNGGSSEHVGITKAELIRQGDAICRRTDEVQKKALAAYEKRHGEAVAFSDVEKALVKAALPPIGTEIEQLDALGAPKGDELRIEIILTGLEKALKAAEKHPNTLLGTGEGDFATPDKLAGTYGFKDCAKAL